MKTFDIILFADVTNYLAPVKGMGPYALATKLRESGYSVKVIDQLNWILTNRAKLLINYLDKVIGDNTLFCGFSCTFMNFVTEKGEEDELGKTSGVTERSRRQIDPRNKLGQFQYRRTSDIDNDIYDVLATAKHFTKLFSYLKEKHPHVKLILGGRGPNAEVMWKMNPFDHWIQGLAETAIIKFTKELKEGQLLPDVYRFDPEASMHNFHEMKPVFSKDDIVMPNEVLPMEISRGCRFKCKFCGFALIGRDPKADKYIRSEDSIYQELKNNYDLFGTTKYFMMCDTVNESIDKLKAMKRAIDRLGVPIEWVGYLRLELLSAHPEQISLLRDIGIKFAHFGIETLNYESAKAVGKGIRTEKALRLLETCKEKWGKDVGLHSGFIVGLPHDTIETFEYWASMLVNGETALDSFMFKGLKIYSNQTEISTEDKTYWYSKSNVPKNDTAKLIKVLVPGLADRPTPYGRVMEAKEKQGYKGKPLQVHQHDDIFLSEFDRNAEKYGYDRTGAYWKSEHWDAVTAQQYANRWNGFAYEKQACTLSAWQSMAATNLIIDDWPLIRRLKHGEDEMQTFKSHLHRRGHEWRKEFTSKLFNI
jgi:hypothetical protein